MLFLKHFTTALVTFLLVGSSVLATPAKGAQVVITDLEKGRIYQAQLNKPIPRGPRVCGSLCDE
jgi:hypothetical protein